MGDWKQMVLGNMGEDMSARRGADLSTALPAVLANLDARNKERRGQTAKAQQTAEKATYAAYPEVAAKRVGIDLGTGGSSADTTGMRKTKITRGGTTYEAPDILDESGIAKIYTDYIMKVQTANAANSKFPGYTPVPIPTLVDFTQQYFPEYVDALRASGGAKKVGGGTIIPEVANIIAGLQAKGRSATDIRSLLKSSKKYSGLNPQDYGI